jgi:hypothetical protein
MFGKKPETSALPQLDPDGRPYVREYEYLVEAYLGAGAFSKGVNALAAQGWELVNGCIAGTVHYAYMRGRLLAPQP